ncbi:hypothetical protein [Lujinxingia vulgaris]|uniref:hypothetical protein n=1 Tax=Lujinxingia vulgaris TaxID=2600176 RepID=UPI001E3A1DB0|nr:hypothetical protein [Lujinxingia vulgaris]
MGLAGALLLLSGCMRQPPEPNRFVPGDALYEQYTTRGKRLIFDGPEGALMKVRLRSKQVRIYDSALRPVGRVRFGEGDQVRASTFGGEEAQSGWVSDDVAELPGHWRVERADERWAIFDAQGQLLGLLEPPAPREGGDAQLPKEARNTALPDELSADDHVLYAALTSPGAAAARPDVMANKSVAPARTDVALEDGEAVVEASHAEATARSLAHTVTTGHDDAGVSRDDASSEPTSAQTQRHTSSPERAPTRGWSLARDYRDPSPLTIDRSETQPRALAEKSEVLVAPAAAAAWSDAALLALTIEALPPLARQALASWVDRNLVGSTSPAGAPQP